MEWRNFTGGSVSCMSLGCNIQCTLRKHVTCSCFSNYRSSEAKIQYGGKFRLVSNPLVEPTTAKRQFFNFTSSEIENLVKSCCISVIFVRPKPTDLSTFKLGNPKNLTDFKPTRINLFFWHSCIWDILSSWIEIINSFEWFSNDIEIKCFLLLVGTQPVLWEETVRDVNKEHQH